MNNTVFFESVEGKISYDDSGNGPLVVCAPGMGDLRSEYRALAPQLVDAGYRVVTTDLRGHGESSVGWKDYSAAGVSQDILGLIRHLDAGPAIVVSNSFSAGAAVWAAAAAPEWVRALVLIGPAVHGKVSWPLRLLLGVLFARPWGPWAWMKYFNTLFPTHKPADHLAYTARLKENMREKGRLEALHGLMLSPTPTSDTRMEQARVPALVLMGSKDPDFKDPAAEASWVAGQLSGTCVMIEGAGHYPQTEMPEITGAHILDFLSKLNVETAHGAAARP